MGDSVRHLEPYGFDTEETFNSKLCGDITITIKENCDCKNNKKDKEQDEEIGKKANTADVNESLTKVANAINKNADDILALSDKVKANSDAIETNSTVNAEQNDKITELSGKVDTCVNITALTSIESAITETLKEGFYTKDEADNKFATNENLSAVTKTIDEKLVALENQDTNLNAIAAHLNESVSANTASIADLKENKLDKSEFNTYTGDTENKLTELSGQVTANKAAIALKAEKAFVETQVETLTNLINKNISDIELKADKTFVAEKNAEIRSNIVEINQQMAELGNRVSDKAELTTVHELSGQVNTFNTYIRDIVNNKAEKSDLEALSGKVDTLTTSSNNNASQEKLLEVSAKTDTNTTEIEKLKEKKQDKGDYVSATTLNDYYTKAETSGSSEIQTALNGKQNKGDYVTTSALNNYYTKAESLNLDDYNEFTGNTKTAIDGKATKESVEQLNNKVDNIQTGTTKALDGLSDLTNEVHSSYATHDYVDDAVHGITTGITANNELIAKISDINNLKLYDKETGQFVNTGNGVLDVLHRKFHLLLEGIDESDMNLKGYISKLEKTIRDLEYRISRIEDKI